MKNFDLNACGVAEMQQQEMTEVNGGFLPLILIGVCLLVSSCQVTVVNGDNNVVNPSNSADSTANGNTAKVK